MAAENIPDAESLIAAARLKLSLAASMSSSDVAMAALREMTGVGFDTAPLKDILTTVRNRIARSKTAKTAESGVERLVGMLEKIGDATVSASSGAVSLALRANAIVKVFAAVVRSSAASGGSGGEKESEDDAAVDSDGDSGVDDEQDGDVGANGSVDAAASASSGALHSDNRGAPPATPTAPGTVRLTKRAPTSVNMPTPVKRAKIGATSSMSESLCDASTTAAAPTAANAGSPAATTALTGESLVAATTTSAESATAITAAATMAAAPSSMATTMAATTAVERAESTIVAASTMAVSAASPVAAIVAAMPSTLAVSTTTPTTAESSMATTTASPVPSMAALTMSATTPMAATAAFPLPPTVTTVAGAAAAISLSTAGVEANARVPALAIDATSSSPTASLFAARPTLAPEPLVAVPFPTSPVVSASTLVTFATAETPCAVPLPKSTDAFKNWLNALDMGHYFASFERHGFDKLNRVLLSTLTDEDLQTLIGVDRVGHRRLFLAEIQLLR
jgi:hypothetical protein